MRLETVWTRTRLRYEPALSMLHLAPFISVAFILLLFALFFTRFCAPPGVVVTAPLFFSESETVQIIVTAEAVCYVNGLPVTDSELSSLFATLSLRNPPVLIKASKKAPLDVCMRIWRVCRQAGIRNVSVVTD